MSRYFVTDPPVAVYEFDAAEVLSDTPPNVIYIRSKMDVATDARVKSELTRLGDDNKSMELRLGDNQMALLIHNIVKWEGPDLSQVPCTPANIRALDPTEPHIALVLETIAERNKRKAAPNPKSSTASGSRINGSPDESPQSAGDRSLPSGNGILKSPLLRALDGHQTRSDD